MTDDAPPILRPDAGRPAALPSLAVVDASGADVATFLQGQLSNDLAGAGASRACLAGYCSPKGRLLALPIVLTLGDGGLRLIVPGDLVEGLLQRLRMFVMRADVTFAVRDDLRCLGLWAGADAGDDSPLAHGVPALPPHGPEAVLDVVGGADGAAAAQMCRWHDAPAGSDGTARARRYLVVAPSGSGEGSLPDGDAAWRLDDIAAGIPRIVAATRDAFVPQMVNLQLVGGLSFRKGCYPGQEIVARMQYLGKLKRHMRRFRTPGGADSASAPTLVPGTALGADGDADAGIVVDAVTTAAGTELLAVVRIAADADALRVGEVPLEPRPLPYALADEASATTSATSSSGERS